MYEIGMAVFTGHPLWILLSHQILGFSQNELNLQYYLLYPCQPIFCDVNFSSVVLRSLRTRGDF